ncbi:MAG: manganese efflux pump MntP family protein [Candidatus Bathyarchaeia archaeon]
MDMVAVLLIAVGLAIDAFAVSIAHALKVKSKNGNDALKMAVSFGSFQAFMPVIGWSAGLGLSWLISELDHWVAFGLLGFVGAKMIIEAMQPKTERNTVGLLTFHVLLMLSVATSLDALAVGLSFGFMKTPIIAAVAVIGAVTFMLSFIGASFGNKLRRFSENKIEAVGGVILIGIGLKILLEHLV